MSEPNSGNGNTLTVDLRTNSGLIEELVYFSTTNPTTGAAEGYLEKKAIRKGTQGTAIPQNSYTYETREAFGEVTHPLRSEATYPDGSNPAVTSYTYTWHTDSSGNPSFQVKEKTTSFPAISTGQNGSGIAGMERRVFDIYGRLNWFRDVRGAITFMAYDQATGAMVQQIEDVDTTRVQNAPPGWQTQPGWGAHLVTDYVADGLARTVQARGPWHDVQLQEGDSAVTPIRRVAFTAYLDAIREVRKAMGYLTGDGPTADLRIVGAVRLTRTDASGRITDEIQSPRSCTYGALSTGESFPQEKWSRWTSSRYDTWGRLTAVRVYHRIPAEGEGTAGVDFLETVSGYDVMNRRNRVVEPSGNIRRMVYETRGLVVGNWIGSDDRSATANDPTGNGAACLLYTSPSPRD